MKILKYSYDNPKDRNGKNKENELLGDFELLNGEMDDYSYQVIVKNSKGELFILTGKEVSGFYYPEKGGTRNSIEKLDENYFVKMYLKYNKKI